MSVPQMVAIALGSNLGDRHANVKSALSRLGTATTVFALRPSPLYESAAERVKGGSDPGGPFINAVAIGLTMSAPIEVLHELHAIERELGRDRAASGHGTPRVIDLDLLLVGSQRVESGGLTLPHPRMTRRMFVLAPLCDIAPQMLVPGTGRTVQQLRDALLIETIGPSVERVS